MHSLLVKRQVWQKSFNSELETFDFILEDSKASFGMYVQVEIDEIPWCDEYNINIDRIDEEHQVILDKINSLIRAMNGTSTQEVSDTFEDLKNYTIEHFTYEEGFMQSFNYSSYESHKKVHENLLNTVVDFGKTIENGTLERPKLASFLKNWLFTHIMGVDSRYAEVYFDRSKSYKKSA